jgi:O-antigen/teichoic acid export membrane protein
MRESSRIIANTLASYGNSLFGLFATLFSARWVLQALGETDFGIYGVVGSIVLLLTFLNGGLQAGVSRFYAFSIGRGKTLPREQAEEELKYWFNTAFSIHSIFPFFIILAGWPIGEYAIQNWLTLPPDRIESALIVFRISLVTAFMSIFTVPFTAMYSAHQLITELAVFGILRSICTFIGSWFLLQVQSDRLVVYALYMMGINAGIPLLQITRAFYKFPVCRVSFSHMYNPIYFKELFSFVGWKMFGLTCVSFRMQGAPILINLYFGPQVNAAYSIANRVSMQAATLSSAMTGAFQPAVTDMEGRGDRERMLETCLRACKFGTLLVLLFAIPLMIEMENVLNLWLKTPPQYAAKLCQWMLAILIVDKLTSGHMLAVNASGKIKYYELIQGPLLLSAIPMAWAFFHFKSSPIYMGFALFLSTVLYCIGRLIFCKNLLGLPIKTWSKTVLLPIIAITCAGTSASFFHFKLLQPGFARLILTTIISFSITSLTSWTILFSKQEKKYFLGHIKRVLPRWGSTK